MNMLAQLSHMPISIMCGNVEHQNHNGSQCSPSCRIQVCSKVHQNIKCQSLPVGTRYLVCLPSEFAAMIDIPELGTTAPLVTYRKHAFKPPESLRSHSGTCPRRHFCIPCFAGQPSKLQLRIEVKNQKPHTIERRPSMFFCSHWMM